MYNRGESHDESNRQIEFMLPEPIKDFVFDLYQSTRRSLQIEEVQQIYDSRFRELTDKYFSSSAWPEPAAIAPECNFDEVFLLLYREMTLRHVFTKLKPQLVDYIASWINFSKLFGFLMKDAAGSATEIALSVQWGYDIVQEFVYQFQGFCQYRCQVSTRSGDDLEMLQANRDVWSLSSVLNILHDMIRVSKITEHQSSRAKTLSIGNTAPTVPNTAIGILGYFCLIDLARLECLLGDYTASLQAIAPIRLWDRTETFALIPACHVNLFYHTGLCLMMSRRYSDAIEIFSDVILHISRLLKPAAGRQGVSNLMQKMMDKALALVGICACLCPGYRVDDHVMELVEMKYEEKMRRLQAGDIAVFESMFELACPKFICPAVPDYGLLVNLGQDAYRLQVASFIAETQYQLSLLRLRSYLRLYTSINLEKLARFNDTTVPELISQLMSFKHKTMQIQCSLLSSSDLTATRVSTSDVQFHIIDKILYVDSAGSERERGRVAERVFISGIRKHVEVREDVVRVFARYGL
mmetsp:Transcript_18772/g.18877  ORF Transcript_18772/g.18877 Transcript_18772/m.18877 type:complete len:524 (+) Transcript_18772:190-1761(+)|eukprot:CAMPEP_0182425004 /NCGR_PEP_ID=MMETSP1167-20130531/11323_1 /TAXON_ID=2988 /ORGANISM="Mallomonas Sp, Strain CCMP3275" /LENGTH=523 /DNA_ID=CAMNT_0024605283 /DNA_START=180 /DNA_END=1751 /DNA_ORIENTATION=+